MYEVECLNTALQSHDEATNVRSWLGGIDKPPWLAESSSLYDNSWILVDKNPKAKPRPLHWNYPLYDPATKRVSILTDPENQSLLEVAQKYCVNLRNGNVSGIDSMVGQYYSTTAFLNFLAWMRLQLVNSINDLKPENFRRFMKDAPFGWVCLLDVEGRFERYVSNLKEAGKKMPTYLCQGRWLRVDVSQVYREIGLNPDMSNGFGVDFTTKLWKTALTLNGRKELCTDNYKKACRDYVDKPVIQSLDGFKKYPLMWQKVYEMSHVLPQKLNFNPAESYVPGHTFSPKEIAKEALVLADIEDCGGMTETIPDLQAFHLIDRAIRWVLLYSEDLIRLRREATSLLEVEKNNIKRFEHKKLVLKNFLASCEVSFTASDFGAPWPLEPVRTPGDCENLSLSSASGWVLMASCAIVIAAFTARRKGEVLGINGGETTEEDDAPRAIYIDENGEPWLWCWIEKTLQKWDRIPVPHVVVKAVEVLEELTAETRMKTNKRNLFELCWFDGDDVFEFDINKYINEFADFVEVPPLDDGSKWEFKAHQFRRFFSLMFMYRYNFGEHGKFEALSYHLRHDSMEMTKRYIEEIKESDMLKAHREHIVTDLMSQVLRGKRNASGPAGDDLKQQLDSMFKEVIKGSKVLSGSESPEVARKIAQMVMDKLGVEMAPFLWGYCVMYKIVDGETFQGNCIKQGMVTSQPDLARATPKRCFGCKHLYVDQYFHPFWETGSGQNQGCVDNSNVSEPLKKIARENLKIFNSGLDLYFASGAEVKHG